MDGILLLLTLTSLLLIPAYTEARQNIYVSACNNNYLNLQCPQNQRIAIKRLFYGVNTAKRCRNRKLGDCCRATQNDCREFDDTVYPKLNNRCSGYEKCSIIVESVPVRSTACQSDRPYTDYMTVIYDCVPIENIASFCSDDVKRGKVLYLANEEYPKPITSLKSSCQCVAATEFSNGINLFSIDVLIARAEFGDRKCSRSITIRDKHAFEKEITCGHRGWFGYRTVYSRTVNNVTLELHNSHGQGTAFVWLEVKATNSNDYVQIHCGESLHRLLVGSHESGESRREDDDIIPSSTTTLSAGINIGESASSYGPNSLSSDMAAIVGGIVVASFFIFTIVIVAIAVHCRRLHKERNKPMKVELYPAIPPSQLETSSYRHYDYDDEHYCSINRSPIKVSSFSDCPTGNQTFRETQPDIVTDHDTTNVKSSDFIENQALIHHTELPQRDYMSIDEREMSGHKTLPAQHTSSAISNPFPTKLPPNKRSKSVTFSQPVAKVTPMNSESEESVPDHSGSKISITYINPDDDYYEFPPPPPLESLEMKQNEHVVPPQQDIQDLYAVVNKPKKYVPIDDDKPYDNVSHYTDFDKSFKPNNYRIQVNGMGTLERQKVETGV